jgi:hypothetical protein
MIKKVEKSLRKVSIRRIRRSPNKRSFRS